MIELSRHVFETLREDAEFAFCRGRRDDGELPTILLIAREFSTYRKAYDLNPLRYDLLKLKGHGLLERDSSRYAYRLTSKGIQVALPFFHKCLCGPLANSHFHHQPDPIHP